MLALARASSRTKEVGNAALRSREWNEVKKTNLRTQVPPRGWRSLCHWVSERMSVGQTIDRSAGTHTWAVYSVISGPWDAIFNSQFRYYHYVLIFLPIPSDDYPCSVANVKLGSGEV